MFNKFDTLYPCHPKDVEVLKIAAKHMRLHTKCDKIYVISEKDLNIDGTIFVPESSFYEYVDLDKIESRWIREDKDFAYRSRWIYQQFLKVLSSIVISTLKEDYLVFDADSIIIRDIGFNTDKLQYCIPRENNPEYIHSYCRIMKERPLTNHSFISHHMLFKKKIMKEIVSYVQTIHDKNFFDAILDCVNYSTLSSICIEYDLYANYVAGRYPEMLEHRQLNWKTIPYVPTDKQLNELAKSYHFVSAHAWAREKK